MDHGRQFALALAPVAVVPAATDPTYSSEYVVIEEEEEAAEVGKLDQFVVAFASAADVNFGCTRGSWTLLVMVAIVEQGVAVVVVVDAAVLIGCHSIEHGWYTTSAAERLAVQKMTDVKRHSLLDKLLDRR